MLISLAAWALAAATLQSGNADLDCIMSRISAADRALIGREVRANVEDGPGSELVVAAAGACAAQRGWDDQFTAGAAAAAAGVLIGEDAQAELARGGISADLIERWFDAMAPAQRASALEGDGAANALIAHLLETGVPADRVEAHGDAIGQYLGALVTLERLQQGLPL